MPLIDSNGLADGDRINSCSKMAQLYYPRMMAASNGYGRMRIDYRQIVASVFPKWSDADLPSEPELLGYFQEYAHNRLIFLYSSAGQLWGQWDAKAGTFGKYQTVADKRSPVPPEQAFSEWVKANREHSHKESVAMAHFEIVIPPEKLPRGSAKLRKDSAKVSPNLPHGVGVGIGDGVTCDVLGVGVPARRARGIQNATQVAKAQGDTRHSRSQQLVVGWYKDWAASECPWGPGEAGQLGKILREWPGSSDAQFVTCLENIARSDCIPKGDRPREWLGKLPKFLHGPLNEFWKPKQGDGNGNGTRPTSKANDREQRIVDRAIKYRTVAAGATDSAGAGSVAVPGNGRSGISGLEREPEILSPRKDSGGIGSHHAEPAKD